MNWRIFCLAFDNSWRADLARAWCRRRALGWCRASDFWAARSRARWALATGLLALAAIQNHRLGLGYRALQYIIAQVRCGRAFRLEHILAQVRLRWARRNARLEHILAHVRFTTRGARRAHGARIRASTGCLFLTDIAIRPDTRSSFETLRLAKRAI